MDESIPVITIDGPAAAGKGTLAHLVARELGFHCLDSGLIYRAAAAAVLAADGDPAQPLTALAGARQVAVLRGAALEDLLAQPELAAEQVGAAASALGCHAEVRAELLDLQRQFRRPPGLVADGRDMATVFADATLKLFLTASALARAARRARQQSATIPTSLRAIRERDARDCGRDEAPLKKGADADADADVVVIDSTGVEPGRLVRQVVGLFRTRLRSSA